MTNCEVKRQVGSDMRALADHHEWVLTGTKERPGWEGAPTYVFCRFCLTVTFFEDRDTS